jgi:hypothetical protein
MINRARRTNSSLSFSDLGELNDSTSFGTRSIKEDLSQFDLTCRLEKFD